MSIKKSFAIAALLSTLLIGPAMVSATSVRHMNLDALTDSAAHIFRGTVTGVKVGTVTRGNSELPTTTYAFRVSESFKGEVDVEKGGERFITVTMVGSLKDTQQTSGIVRFDRFRDVPRLEKGGEYLLFTTAKSQLGLSVTVGLAQGCFDIQGDMALNRAGNLGLFYGTAYAGPAQGAIAYDELADRIRATLSTR